MLNLNTYLENVKEELKSTRNRESKVENSILDLVKETIEEGKATTVKYVATSLNKSTQQIHQVLKKATTIRKEKVNGRTLIVPSDMA